MPRPLSIAPRDCHIRQPHSQTKPSMIDQMNAEGSMLWNDTNDCQLCPSVMRHTKRINFLGVLIFMDFVVYTKVKKCVIHT